MKILNIFGKNKKFSKKPLFDCGIDIDKTSFYQIYSASLGKILVQQSKYSELVVKNSNWNLDFDKGLIYFGEDNYPIQFIGSESNVSDSWMWAWNNINGFNEDLLIEAKAMKNFGMENDLEALTLEKCELSDLFNGHNFAIVASAMSQDNVCYYRGPHAHGAVFVAFSNVDSRVFDPIDHIAFSKYTMDAIQNFDIDHMIFVASFLNQNGCKSYIKPLEITGEFSNKAKLNFEFEKIDSITRLKNIKSI